VLRVWRSAEPLLGRSPLFSEVAEGTTERLMHVAAVLLSERSRGLLLPRDVAFLFVAAVLRDLALRASPEDVAALASGRVASAESSDWPALWSRYRQEASRLSGQASRKLFGHSLPVAPPELGTDGAWLRPLSERQRLLVGEFMRRHLGRFANLIALRGTPSGVDVLDGLGEAERHLCGLIASSSDMSFRVAIDRIRSTGYGAKGVREPLSCRVPLVMGLLRVAGYLDVDRDCAPRALRDVTGRLRCPVSKPQWRSALDVREVRWESDDAEAILIEATPANVTWYLNLKALLDDLQAELDGCWAVLGETYGRAAPLSELGLSVRRVRSNMDDEASVRDLVDFEPDLFRFDTAGPALLKTLIGPLYGDRPEFAVRELVANSVDAVRELRAYLRRRGESTEGVMFDRALTDCDVYAEYVETDDGDRFIVTDRGIGMTTEVIKEFFLKAGASFRESDAWRLEFGSDNQALEVVRTGRFGVGAFAAFLFGNRLKVRTRHVADDEGYEFSGSIDDEHLEVRRIPGCPVGTRVEIEVSDPKVVRDQLDGQSSSLGLRTAEKWDWYGFESVRVIRAFLGDVLPQSSRLPFEHEGESARHRAIETDRFPRIMWWFRSGSMPERGSDSSCPLFCNGFKVFDPARERWTLTSDFLRPKGIDSRLRTPNIAILDPRGHLPLDVKRTSLRTSYLREMWEVCEDVALSVIGYFIAATPEGPDDWDGWSTLADGLYDAGFSWRMGEDAYWPEIGSVVAGEVDDPEESGYSTLLPLMRGGIACPDAGLIGGEAKVEVVSLTDLPDSWLDNGCTNESYRFIPEGVSAHQNRLGFSKQPFGEDLPTRGSGFDERPSTPFGVLWMRELGTAVISFDPRARSRLCDGLGPRMARHVELWSKH